MIPVLTPAEMAAVDAAAPEPLEALIQRAAAAVARSAVSMMGGTYGRRVVVLAGPGNNGADGRLAAANLQRRGARVAIYELGEFPAELPPCDLCIDAAFGTGLSRAFEAPLLGASAPPVLAVDIASGVSGLTGRLLGSPLRADHTVTFAALKPGLIFEPGAHYAGTVEVADIGLDVSGATQFLVEAADLRRRMGDAPSGGAPSVAAGRSTGSVRRGPEEHKWRRAAWAIAGSAHMRGAAQLSTAAALRSGAGYVRISSPGLTHDCWDWPIEAVQYSLPAEGWADAVLAEAPRFGALLIGPGLGRSDALLHDIRRVLARCEAPVILDGDALSLLGRDVVSLAGRPGPTVLTPHDGEFETLTGTKPGEDRVESARALARCSGSVVLLKGPATVVADPEGNVMISTAGDQRLATAGTGDVLAGILAAMATAGLDVAEAAIAAAEIHGLAGKRCEDLGMIASDLIDAIPRVLADARTPT
jgi:hydroxyethylthiazole kinase-like uncharacterized protein yjeF